MSSLLVNVVKIDDVKIHDNADNLSIAVVGGWETVIKKGQYKKGDEVIYIPIDTIVPQGVSDKWGVTQYLSKGRVRAARLRGVVSYGFIVDNDEGFPLGFNAAEHYGITKWEPPVISDGLSIPSIESFPRYTDIENIKNFMDIFCTNETVVLTEKQHGSSFRIGLINIDGAMTLVAGSHNRRVICEEPYDNMYSMPLRNENLHSMLTDISGEEKNNVIVYGEIYGDGVQDIKYGMKNGQKGFSMFDLNINGKYVNTLDANLIATQYKIPFVANHGIIPFNFNHIQSKVSNPSLMNGELLEGFVIRPIEERTHPKIGRVILKMINPEYLLRKHGTENH